MDQDINNINEDVYDSDGEVINPKYHKNSTLG